MSEGDKKNEWKCKEEEEEEEEYKGRTNSNSPTVPNETVRVARDESFNAIV